MSDTNLLPCPFCGEEADTSWVMDESAFSHATVKYHRIACGACDFHMSSENEAELISTWNTRIFPLECARSAAKEICKAYDVSTPRGVSYANPKELSIAIIIQTQQSPTE